MEINLGFNRYIHFTTFSVDLPPHYKILMKHLQYISYNRQTSKSNLYNMSLVCALHAKIHNLISMNTYTSAYLCSLTIVHVAGLYLYASLCESNVISVHPAGPGLKSDCILQLKCKLRSYNVGEF
jgi:hypothetical protein